MTTTIPRDITEGQRWTFKNALGGPDRHYEVVVAEPLTVRGAIVTLRNVETGGMAYPSRSWLRFGPDPSRGTWEYVAEGELGDAA